MSDIRFVIEKHNGEVYDVVYHVSPEFENDPDALRGIIKSYLGRRMQSVNRIVAMNNTMGTIKYVYPEKKRVKESFPKGLFTI